MFRVARVEKGTCKCGGELLLERKPGGGFVSHHSAPLCAEYEQILREHPPQRSEVTTVVELGPDRRANAEVWAATHGSRVRRDPRN